MRELKIAEDALRAIAGKTSIVPYYTEALEDREAARRALAAIEAVRAERRKVRDELAEVCGTVTGTPIAAQRATWGPSGGTPPEPAYVEDFSVQLEIEGKTFNLFDRTLTDDLVRDIEAHVLSALESRVPEPYED